MKRKIVVTALTLALVSCSASASYSEELKKNNSFQSIDVTESKDFVDTLINKKIEKTQIEKDIEAKAKKQAEIADIHRYEILTKNALKSQIKKLKKYLGKTYYVFSGSTPGGWDCSGLVRWYYEGLGIDLPHSANKQGHLKPKVKNPKPGDIVVFKYVGASTYHHSGIYIGKNKVLHAGFKKGDSTEILDLDSRYFLNNEINFIRIANS